MSGCEGVGTCAPGRYRSKAREQPDYIIAVAGNPNVGKSTVFNALTGMNQHTGNWPGKTVATMQGRYEYKGRQYRLVDLPGTYSLCSKSEEERIAGACIESCEADCVIVVCDSTCLERNLNLALQILELTERVIVCVNLLDEAKKKEIEIDLEVLQRELGVPVVGTAAAKREGLTFLQERVRSLVEGFEPLHPVKTLPARDVLNEDAVANAFVRRSEAIARKTVRFGGDRAVRRQRRLDHILTGQFTGFPILLLLLLLILYLTIQGANYPSALLQAGFDALGGLLWRLADSVGLAWFLSRPILDGVYATVACVVSVMLPPMAIFFPLFTLLEDLGYLPRVAFLLDHSFQKSGACGKQALTMCMGLGCNAAGVIGCRIIDSPRDRLIAILTNCFVPCNGKFPALMLLIVVFFGGGFAGALILLGFILLGIFMTLLVSRLLGKTVLCGMPSSFALEMPPFRRPQVIPIIVRSLFDRTLFVLGRAAAVAAPCGLVIWCFANLSIGGDSLLHAAAGLLNPMGVLLGMNGAILLAFLLSVPANELVLTVILMSLTTVSGIGAELGADAVGQALLAAGWTWKTALCTMVFFLFHFPCSTTTLTIYKETGSKKWTLVSVLLPTVVGMLLCMLLNFML